MGVAGKFPPKYMGFVFSGQAIGGIFASVTNVVVMLLGADQVGAAFFCFLIAVVFLGTFFREKSKKLLIRKLENLHLSIL